MSHGRLYFPGENRLPYLGSHAALAGSGAWGPIKTSWGCHPQVLGTAGCCDMRPEGSRAGSGEAGASSRAVVPWPPPLLLGHRLGFCRPIVPCRPHRCLEFPALPKGLQPRSLRGWFFQQILSRLQGTQTRLKPWEEQSGVASGMAGSRCFSVQPCGSPFLVLLTPSRKFSRASVAPGLLITAPTQFSKPSPMSSLPASQGYLHSPVTWI